MKRKNHITYYDFNDLRYSSYFLTGFYHNSEIFSYRFNVSKAIPILFYDQAMTGKWRENLFSICLFKVKTQNDEFYFCIDTRDSCERKRGNGYHIPLLKKVKYYFKVNYDRDAVNSDPGLAKFANKIIPSLPFFPIKCPKLLQYYPRIIPRGKIAWTMKDTARRIKAYNDILSLEQIKQMRNSQKDHDIFFVTRYYNEEIHSADNEFRYQIMKEIKNYSNINSVVGFAGYKVPGKYAEYQLKPFSLKNYLGCLARSKTAIYVRGLHNCLSFKFGQLLSLGMPIVGQTIKNNRDNIMNNKYFDEQFAYNNPKEIAQEIAKLLINPVKQKELSISNANIFDAKFSPRVIVSDILRQINF